MFKKFSPKNIQEAKDFQEKLLDKLNNIDGFNKTYSLRSVNGLNSYWY